MPRSAVYRSFIACNDPKGVAYCRIRKSKNTSMRIMEMEDRDVSSFRRPEASRDCYDELREVIRESFARQSLKGIYCGDRKDLDLCVDLLPSSSSSIRAAAATSPTQVEKPKAGNLIAKLMGLDEFVLPSHQRSRLLDIDLLTRPRSVVHKVVGERLRKSEETMQCRGLIVSERGGTCQSDLSFLTKMLAVDGRPPIVVMRPQRVPHFHSITIKGRQKPRGVREEFPRRVMVAETNDKFRVERINNGKVDKDKQGRFHCGDLGEKALISTKKINYPKPLVPRVHKNEAVAKRINGSPKLASNTRKQAGIIDAKTRDQGKSTTLKLNRRTTRDSNVTNRQNASPEKKTKPNLWLSSVPKKNLRKSKPNRKPAAAPVENIHNEGSLSINIESSITQSSMMNSCYVSTSDNSTNAKDKNDMKCVEDGACIPGSSLDNTKDGESIYNMRRLLLSSASFLCLVEELFDVGTYDTKILQTPSSHNSEMSDDSLLLDCAMEILQCKSKLCCTWAIDPLSRNLFKSPKRCLSLRQLIGEIADGIEVLTNYNKSCDGKVHTDRIYTMLERDLWWNEEVTGAWDLGWRTGNATEDVNMVVHDLEELVLREIIADLVLEFMFW